MQNVIMNGPVSMEETGVTSRRLGLDMVRTKADVAMDQYVAEVANIAEVAPSKIEYWRECRPFRLRLGFVRQRTRTEEKTHIRIYAETAYKRKNTPFPADYLARDDIGQFTVVIRTEEDGPRQDGTNGHILYFLGLP